MSQLIKVKRGTLSQIQAQAATLALGEPVFSTDTKELFVGDGVGANLVGKCLADTLVNRPAAGILGRLFYATDEQYLYVDEVTSWRMFDPVGIQKYDFVNAATHNAGKNRTILVDAASNDVAITLSSSSEIDGRTYYISRIDSYITHSVFVTGEGLAFLIGDPRIAISDGYAIGSYTLGQDRNIEIVWRDSASKWEHINQLMFVDGGAF